MKYGLIVIMIASNVAFAQLFRLNVSDCGTLTGTSSSGQCGDFTSALQDEVNGNFPDLSGINGLGDGMSNASVISSKGNQASDYSNEIDIIQVGIGFGFGFDAGSGSLSNTSDEVDGFGISPALMVGLNPSFMPIDKIGPIEMDRLRLFGNFFAYNFNQDMDDGDVETGITSIGFRARYHLMDGAGASSLLKWGGIHLTTGYQYSKLEIDASANINQTVSSGGASGDLDGTMKFSGEVITHSIPIEVSTYAQLGYVFTVFGGLATDLSFGSGEFNLDSSINVTNVTGAGTYAADGNFNLGDDGGPQALLFRAFMGIQLNVPVFKIYVQGQKTLGRNIYGANVGFKLNW